MVSPFSSGDFAGQIRIFALILLTENGVKRLAEAMQMPATGQMRRKARDCGVSGRRQTLRKYPSRPASD